MDRQLIIFHVESVISFLESQTNKKTEVTNTVKNISNMDEAIENLKIVYSLLMKG
jgi:hypothetical protein